MTAEKPPPGRGRRASSEPRPTVILPPSAPGGRERRFELRPQRVFAVLLAFAVLGAAASAGAFAAFWFLSGQGGLRPRLAELEGEVDQLRSRLAELQAAADAAALPTEAEAAPAEEAPGAPPLAVRLPSTERPPTVRIAVFRASGGVELRGEGLLLVTGNDKAVPMPGGVAIARPTATGVFVEGVGTLPDGTPVENRLGPILVGDREFPGRLELHREDDKLLLVNELDLERYLQGVVGSELPASWDIEAKKAQAVAARTYALMQRATAEGAYHLEATVDDQVYDGAAADGTSRAAVAATHGEVLSSDGWLVSAFYHSTCGGRTESPADIWPDRPSRGVRPISCDSCEASPSHRWSVDFTPEDLSRALERAGHAEAGRVTGLHVRERSESDRVTRIDLLTETGTVTLSGDELRRAMGWNRLRSSRFEVEARPGSFRLRGSGAGHGAGLCQWGAQGLAVRGVGYRDILARYYPDAKVEKIY